MIRSCCQYLFLWRAGIPENAYCASICHYLVLLNNNNLYSCLTFDAVSGFVDNAQTFEVLYWFINDNDKV